MAILITCLRCDGSTIEPGTESDPCLNCSGTGQTVPPDRDATAQAWLEFAVTKLDAIITEQASQRVDLTAALLQIWNKVKDL